MTPWIQLVVIDLLDTCATLDAGACPEATPTPLPGVTDSLACLRAQGVRLALASPWDAATTTRVLTRMCWATAGAAATAGDAVVDALVCAGETPVEPPAPHKIHVAMARTGVLDVHRVLAVGASTCAMRAARNSGGLAIGVLTGGATPQALLEAGADDVLDSAADLPHWIARARVHPPMTAA